jgi:hypothetical protein
MVENTHIDGYGISRSTFTRKLIVCCSRLKREVVRFFCCLFTALVRAFGRLTHERLRNLSQRFCRTPLGEWSACRKGQHCTEIRGQTSMPSAGFEPTISASKRLASKKLIGENCILMSYLFILVF